MPNNVLPSADELIAEIREMHDKSRRNASRLSCDMIEQKIARRESATRITMKNHDDVLPTEANFAKRSSRPFDKYVGTGAKIELVDDGEEKRDAEKIVESPKGEELPIDTAEEGCLNPSCMTGRSCSVPGSYLTLSGKTTKLPRSTVLPKVLR